MSKSDYDTIMNLAKNNNFKKIMVMRDSWGYGSWCIVNKVMLNSDERYGLALGHIHYSDGNVKNGLIDAASTYSWKVIKVFDEMMDVEHFSNKNGSDENVSV